MSTGPTSTGQRRDLFWFPFHPAFRWPMRLMGGALLVWAASGTVLAHNWRIGALTQGLSLVLASFEQPDRRRKTRRDCVACWFLQMLLLAAVAGAGWVAFLCATDYP